MHIQSINYTSEIYHRKICQEVGEWKYPVIGKYRKGWFRPYHAQVYIDDYRLPEVCASQFVRDLEFSNGFGFVKASGFNSWALELLLKIFRLFGPWKSVKKVPTTQLHQVTGWRYNVLIGVVKDPVQKCNFEQKYKEVL